MLIKHTILSFFCLAFSVLGFAQLIHTKNFPAMSDKRGALLAVNEMHGVTSNNETYLDILKHLNTQLPPPGDTINLFLEIPYSKSVLLNDYYKSNGDSRLHLSASVGYPSIDFIDSIIALQIPVRFFGCDFEYDEKYKRNASFIYLLQKLSADMSSAKLDVQLLDSYIQSVKDFNIKSNHTTDLYKQLKQLQPAVDNTLKAEIGQVLFALDAPQKFGSGRDGDIFERTLTAIKLGYFDYKNHFNLLIHGVAHINPSFKNSLFNRFRNDKASPFVNHAFIIGNVYIECKNDSGIFNKINISSSSFYPIPSDDKPITTYFLNKDFPANSVNFISPEAIKDLNFPNLSKSELLGVYVHYKINNLN